MNLKRISTLTVLAVALASGGHFTTNAQIYPQEELHFRAPAVPRQIIFAGDTVRFDRSDLYERMDRELISFTYMHSNSILMQKKSAMDLWLVEETSRYMFRVLSAKMFFENPSAFGFNVKDFEKYPCYSPKEVVTVSGAIASLVDFAEEHGVTYYQLKEANLWLRDNKLLNNAGHTYKIIIPSGK